METSPNATFGFDRWAEQFTTSLHDQRDRVRQFLDAQCERLRQAEAIVESELHRLEAELDAHRSESNRWRSERDAIAARLAEAESRLAVACRQLESDDLDGQTVASDLQHRYEMAVEEIRLLRDKNADLQEQASRARTTASKLVQQAREVSALNWEAEKQRILALLETECADDDEERQIERATINDVLRTTHEIIAAKDAEIRSLKDQLEQNRGGAAQSPDALRIEQAVNADAAVCEERERLLQLQEQWREKLCTAEVELALERANLARQRAVLEESSRNTQKSVRAQSKATDANPQAGRHWLAQLGLSEDDWVHGRQL